MSGNSAQPPYWGALPPPAVVAQRQASVRRNSHNSNRKAAIPDDAALRGLHDSPYPSEAQPARSNRLSQQSHATESTENSFASPREAEFNRGGLAPRPASYQSQPYNREAEERRRRRASRQQAEERAEFEQRGGIPYDGGVTSSGPIKSNGNGHGLPPNRPISHRQTQRQDRTPLREPEDFYRGEGNRYKPQRGPLSVDTNLGRANTTGSRSQQQQAADDAERGIRRGSVTARKEKPEIRSAVEDTRARRVSSRRVSEVSQEGFTSDKSPLQALEANYTKLKEEKRAKAQEAERQIRERQASGASAESARGAQNTVHFDGSSEQATKTVPQRAIVEVAGQDISPTTTAPNRQDSQRKLSALSQPLEDRPSQRKLQKDPPSAIHSSAPQKVPTVIEPGVQRNASFRERAAVGPESILGTTAAVSRSNTNKLKKNPPGDPWRLTREDIEAQAEEIARARKVEREQQQRMASGGPLGSSPIDPPPQQMMSAGSGSGRSHANTKKQREALYAAAQPLHQDEDEVNMASTKKSGSQRKAEQLLGPDLPFQRPNPDIRRAISPAEQQLFADRLDRSEELGPDGHGDIYGVTPAGRRQNVPISAITGDNISDGEYEQARGSDGHHHFSNIIRGGRGNYRPGAGLYQPDVRLDEWKTARIASLTGALLDLDTNAQAASAAQLEADKDKAWWEAGNTGKRRPSTGASGRVRAVEAFGGDMSSEGNNGTVFSDFSYSYEDGKDGERSGVVRSTTPRTSTPSHLERWGRATDDLFDIPERSGSPAYSDRYGRGATPSVTPTREVPPRLRSPYSQRSARPAVPRVVVPPRRSSRHEQNSQSIAETLEQLVSEAPAPPPGLHTPKREKSKRRGAVAVVGEDEDHVIPRARNYIGFDGTSKRKSTVRKRNRSLVQPTRFSKKAKPKKKPSARRAKPPTVAAIEAVAVQRSSTSTSTKLQKKPSFFMKDCAHPERHTIFHPFHTCKSILPSKRISKKKDRLTSSVPVVPTTFTPKLYLKCGPLLRYTGIRRETVATRPGQPKRRDREIWRGSVMIVTTDAASDYHEPPRLRLFKQPKSLLPPPPETLASGEELPHEYIDPIANQPKCGRDGQTLYVKPVEFLPEEKDLSRDESDRGLFSRMPSNSYPSTTKPTIDGDKLSGKSVSVRGFRLHTERGATFWRFNIEVELTTQQQRIAYRINNGPSIGFWVPALGEGMNIMNYSCNGFSMSVSSDMFSGPDPLWRDVLNNHQTRPFHVMIGGGDQVYNDCVMRQTSVFAEWLTIKNPLHKHNAPFTSEMQDELEDFYLERYSMWFSQGLFSLANSQIPMVNLWDDHDIIDGFGSYPHHFMDSPVFTGLGAIAFKYYMLFQHQSSVDEGPANEPSWLLGTKPGPYIKERSRSLFMSLGGGLSFLGLDCRTERTRDEILSEQTYDAILDRCYAELVKGTTTHLIVLLGVPIAYPRLVWLENILTSRIMDPIKALSRAGAFGNLLNNFDGGVEILDDLDDHWTAKNHKAERRFLIQDLQDLAASKSVRITILSGDVHLAAIGQFFSSGGADGLAKTGQVPKDKDHRYMPNVISSAIVNTPPPDMLADVLARRDKVHHLDGDTDENMIPLFGVDVDGKKRNNKVMLPRRNWASIRVYDGLGSPPGTPGASRDPSPEKSGGIGGLVRRLSMTKNDSFGNGPRRNDSFGPHPPISGGGVGLLRRLSTSRGRPPPGTFDGAGEAVPQRRSSSTGGIGGLIRRLSMSRPKRRDRSGINGYESSDEEEEYRPYRDAPDIVRTKQGTFLRGGAGDLSSDEEEYNPTRLRGGGAMTRSEEAIEQQHGYFPPKKGYRRGEDAHDSDGGTATPPPIRTGMRGTSQGAPIARSNTFADSRHASIAQGVPGSRDGLQRSNTTNTLRKSLHRTPTGMSAKGGIFGRKAAIEPVNLEGGLEITLNVEVNRKDPAGITAPYRLLVPRLFYEEPVRPEGGPGGATDGAMETPPLQRGNSFSGGLGGLMRRLSTKGKISTQAEIEREQSVVRDDGYAQPRVGDTIGTEGLQRKPTVTDRVKGVFGLGLGRRRSGESYSGTGSESGEDPHADSRLVPLAKYGKKGQIKKENIGKPILNPGPGIEDEETDLSRAPPAAPTAPQPPAKPTAYRNEPSRTVYRDPNTEAALERRSLDRPQGGMQRANSLSAKLKGAMGLGRRDSAGSYTDEGHDETYDTAQGHVGVRPRQQQTRQRESIDRGAPARPDAGMKRGNSLGGGLKKALGLGRRDTVESFSGSERSYDEPVLPPSKQTAPVRDTRGPYPSLQQENQQRRQSLDRPQAGIQRRNTLTDKLKGVVGLGRRDSYSGSEAETDDISPHGQRRAPLAKEPPRPPRTQDTRGLPPSQRPSMDTGRPQQGPRKSSLGEGLKKAMGLGRQDSYSDHSYSEDDESHLEPQTRNDAAGQRDGVPLPQDQARGAEKKYPPQPRAQKQSLDSGRRSLDTGRPQQGPRKSSLGSGLKKAMGLGRSSSFSDHSYSDEDDSVLPPRNNAAGQRIPPPQADTNPYPSPGQKSQPPRRASLEQGRPAGHQRKSSLGGGLAKAIGLGGGKRDNYDSQTESDDESIARRQANERANATGDMRYPSLPQGGSQGDLQTRGSQAHGRQPPMNNMPRQSLDRRDSQRNRVDSGPMPVKRKGMGFGAGVKNMIGLGRKESFGSRSGSERSWSEDGGEEKIGRMPRGDERSAVTDDEGDRRFRKVSGTKVERGAPVLKEGMSGFTRQERQRARMEELGREMERPGPAR